MRSDYGDYALVQKGGHHFFSAIEQKKIFIKQNALNVLVMLNKGVERSKKSMHLKKILLIKFQICNIAVPNQRI